MEQLAQLTWREFWHSVVMGPSNFETAAEDGPAIDAKRIAFDIKTVWAIVAGSIGVVVTVLATTFGVRGDVALVQSDVRVILARMEAKVDLDAATARLNDERLASLRTEIADMRRRIELLQFENQQLKETILKSGR